MTMTTTIGERNLLGAICIGLALSTSTVVRAEQSSPTAAVAVAVGGAIDKPLHLDVAALAKLPRENVEAVDHGATGHWSGVKLIDVLHAAGVPSGEALRGKWLGAYVRIGAADGYHAVFSLAELDPSFRDEQVILADTRDGKPLDAKEGPFRIIAAGEKRPARWVRQVMAIDVVQSDFSTR